MIRIQMRYEKFGNNEIDLAILWCVDKFGIGCGRKWNYVGHGKFSFIEEENAILFALRWA